MSRPTHVVTMVPRPCGANPHSWHANCDNLLLSQRVNGLSPCTWHGPTQRLHNNTDANVLGQRSPISGCDGQPQARPLRNPLLHDTCLLCNRSANGTTDAPLPLPQAMHRACRCEERRPLGPANRTRDTNNINSSVRLTSTTRSKFTSMPPRTLSTPASHGPYKHHATTVRVTTKLGGRADTIHLPQQGC